MERKIGFGIIGLGTVAATHAAALAAGRNCYLAGAYSSTEGKAEMFCRTHGGTPYTDLRAFFADPAIEAVCITTPSGDHMDPALASIGAGKHVLIEKPLEITVERCDRIIAAAGKAGVKLSGVFQSRFYDAPRLVKDALDSGRFGRIMLADAQFKYFRSQEYYDSGVWRGTVELDGGGVLINQGIHAVDLLRWFMGGVARVGAFTSTLAHQRIDVEDAGVAALRFDNGALGIIEGTTGAFPGAYKRIEICGTDGSVVLEEESIKLWTFRQETGEDALIRSRFADVNASVGGVADPRVSNTVGHERQIEDFADAILYDREPAVTGEDARTSVALVLAMYESAKTDAFVTLR